MNLTIAILTQPELPPWSAGINSVWQWSIICILPILLVAALFYELLSMPLKRRERTRFILDAIDSGLQYGQSPEHTICAMSQSQDASLDVRFHWLACHLENKDTLLSALEKVPLLVPPQIQAILRAGQAMGDLQKVLPACRAALHDGVSQSRASLHYQVVLAFVLNPVTWSVMFILFKYLMPLTSSFGLLRTREVQLWLTSVFVFGIGHLALVVLVYIGALLFIGGPHLLNWLERGWFSVSARLFYRVPWIRYRLQRDFSCLLAILLDAGVPESKAVELAAQSTANAYFIRRSQGAIEALRQGYSLAHALGALDESGEFRWRLDNASQARGGFSQALAGWHVALEARAFQQEQASAQFISTTLLVLNGLLFAFMATGFFKLLGLVESGWAR